MELADQLQKIITSDGLVVLSVLCFYIFSKLSRGVSLCKKKILEHKADLSEANLELTAIISHGHLFKGMMLGLGLLFFLHFMKLSGADLGQAFKSLFNIQKGSDGSGGSIVKIIALIVTVISGLVLNIAHKQVEKLDKELEKIRKEADIAIDEIKVIKDKADTTIDEIEVIKDEASDNIKRLKKDAEESIGKFQQELNIIKEESKKSHEDFNASLSHLSSQNVANIELNRLIRQSTSRMITSAQKPDLELFRDLIGYEFNRMSSVVVIDAIDSLSKNNINKEWLEDNSIFGNYIGSLYKQFSRIDDEDNSYKEVMRKIKPFVPESFFSLK